MEKNKCKSNLTPPPAEHWGTFCHAANQKLERQGLDCQHTACGSSTGGIRISTSPILKWPSQVQVLTGA